MRHRVVTFTILLEAYALLLAVIHLPLGLRTDEAKYLLSIPYPHPPLLREMMAFTSSVPAHEFLWRFLFASLLVQMAWLFVDLGTVLTAPRRRALLAGWLFSSAILLQGGTIMMVVPTACFGAFFVWCALHPTNLSKRTSVSIALLWLVALFVAYQSLLFVPLVWSSFLRTTISWKKAFYFTVIPIVLLTLYTFSNPLALASILNVSVKDAVLPMLTRLNLAAVTLLLGGSAVLTLTGIIGILSSRRTDLVLSFAFVFGYAVLSHQSYYAILFTPLLVGGTFLLLCKRKLRPSFLGLAHILLSFFTTWMLWPHAASPLLARETMRILRAQTPTGIVVIIGPFGHEWQYEANTLSIRKFSPLLSTEVEDAAVAIVCTQKNCDQEIDTTIWIRMPEAPVPTWVKRG